jgi:hypothetical protein
MGGEQRDFDNGRLHLSRRHVRGPPTVVALGHFDETLLVLAVGIDNALWWARLDGFLFTDDEDQGNWSAWQSLGGQLTAAPSAVRSEKSAADVFACGPRGALLHWRFGNGSYPAGCRGVI